MKSKLQAMVLISALAQGSSVMGTQVIVNVIPGQGSEQKMVDIPPQVKCNGTVIISSANATAACDLMEDSVIEANRVDGKKPCNFKFQNDAWVHSGESCDRWKLAEPSNATALTLKYCNHRESC